MIEAVNSVLSNASMIRGNAEQIDVARSPGSVPQTDKEIAVPKAPYISPFLSIDVNFDTTVLQIRDSETGDVINQYPSESRLQQKQRAAENQAQNEQLASSGTGESSEIRLPQQESGTQPTQTAAVPEAQIASAALATAAQTSVNALSAGVSVAA